MNEEPQRREKRGRCTQYAGGEDMETETIVAHPEEVQGGHVKSKRERMEYNLWSEECVSGHCRPVTPSEKSGDFEGM